MSGKFNEVSPLRIVNSILDGLHESWKVIVVGSRIYRRTFDLIEQMLCWYLNPTHGKILVSIIDLRLLFGVWRDVRAVRSVVFCILSLPSMIWHVLGRVLRV